MTRSRKVLIAVMVAIMFWLSLLIFFRDNGLLELARMRDSHRQLLSENEGLVQDNLRMLRIIDRLHNDPGYIEDVARKELGMVRSDELIFTFASGKEDGEQ